MRIGPTKEGLLMAVACLGLCACAATVHAQTPPVFPISAVIEQVKREIAAAQGTAGASLQLKLDRVEATLVVARAVDANGKVAIGVPLPGATADASAGGGRKTEESSTVYVELVPPKPLGVLAATDAKDFGLTQAIVETRRELLKGLAVEPRLDPRKVVITVKFTVIRNIDAGAQIKLVVLSAGGGASVASTDSSSIALTFSRQPL